MFFITNQNDNIVAQTMTSDFNINYIMNSHHLVSQLNQTLEGMNENDQIKNLILQTINNISINMNNLNLSEFDLKNLICISETLSSNKLIWKAGEILRELTRKVKYGR